MTSMVSAGDVRERHVVIGGSRCRVWESGHGEPLVVLHGIGGLPRWTPFLERLAERRRVIAPSLPGQHGSERGHEQLNNLLDWLAMTLDVIDATGVQEPVDLIGMSSSGMLAGEVAALSRGTIRRLVLVGSFGLFDETEPTTNIYAISPEQRPGLLTADAAAYKAAYGPDSGAEPDEDFVATNARADEVVARLIWPFGDIKIKRRLHRIVAPTLLLWGADDPLVPPTYAKRFADGIAGASQMQIIDGARHLVTIDAPDQCVAAVNSFLSS